MQIFYLNKISKATLLIFIIFLCKLVISIWGINRGVDLTDEGWYLLMLNYPFEDKSPFHEFHTVLASLIPISQWGILEGRISKILIEIINLSLLCIIYLRHCVFNRKPISLTELSFISSGIFLSIFSRTVSYYELIPFFTLLSIVSLQEYYNRKKYIFFFLFFLFATFLIYIKFTVCLLLISSLIFIKNNISLFRIMLSLFIALPISWLVFHHITHFSFIEWLDRFITGYEVFQLIGYDFTTILGVYLKDAFFIFISLVFPITIFLFVKSKKLTHLILLLFSVFITSNYVISLICNHFIAYKDSWFYTSSSFYILTLFILINIFKIKVYELTFSTKLVLLAPIIIFLGSDTEFTFNLFCYINIWCLAIVLLLQNSNISIHIKNRFFQLLSLYSFIIFFIGSIYFPYHLNGKNLLEQKNEYLSPSGDKLLIDDESYMLYTKIEKELKNFGYQKGQPIISLFNKPGIVYLMGGYSPGTGWYFGGQYIKEEYAFTKHYVESIKFDRKFYFLLDLNIDKKYINLLNEKFDNRIVFKASKKYIIGYTN